MPTPSSTKDIQHLTGKLAAISRFLSRLADRSASFFKTPKGKNIFHSEKDCDQAFEQLKQHLSSPCLLAKPIEGETIFLYVHPSTYVVSEAFVWKDGAREEPVYFISKVLAPAETRYSLVEKMILAVVIASRELKPYFQVHNITVLTSLPLRASFLSTWHKWMNDTMGCGIS